MSRPFIPLPKDFADHLNLTVRELTDHYSVGRNTINRFRREYFATVPMTPRKGHHNRPHTEEGKRNISAGVRAAWAARSLNNQAKTEKNRA